MNNLNNFINKLKELLNASTSKNVMDKLGEEASNIIVKRTRLGYGVDGTIKSKLGAMRSWSDIYRKFRLDYPEKLDSTTRPLKQNLTYTGQMLRSFGVIKTSKGQVIIGSSGTRNDGLTNQEVEQEVTDRGWIFNKLSSSEEKQLIRIYRKTFGDLVKTKLT